MAQDIQSKYYLEVLLNKELHLYAPLDTTYLEIDKSTALDKQLESISETASNKAAELHILFQPLCFSLIPEVLFEASDAPLYLDIHHSQLSNSFISYESLDFAAIEMVYAIPKAVAHLFQQKFENAYWHCRPTALLQWIADKSKAEETTSVWVSGDDVNELMIALFKNGRLLFYNTFNTHSKNDQLYYCLAIAEQQALDKQNCTVHFLGKNTPDTLKTALKKQFANTQAHENISEEKINSPYIYLEAMHLCAS